MAFLKQFEAERKFEIFKDVQNDEMFEYDLSDFVFDVEQAQNIMGDNVYYTIDDDKVLYIQQSYYLQKVDDFIKQIKDIM